MIEDIKPVSSRNKVSSQDTREFDDRAVTELSNQYHRILELTGKVRNLATCLSLTSQAIGILTAHQAAEEGTVRITPSTTPIYPTSCTDRAECVPEYGIIMAGRIASRRVFLTDGGEVLPSLTIYRSSNNSLYLEKPDRVIENRPEHALIGDIPYLAQFVRDNMGRANVIFTIASTDTPFEINALRFLPMPVAGSVVLEKVQYGDGNPVIVNGSNGFTETEGNEITRTYPAYVHFEPVTTNRFIVSCGSELYYPEMQSVIVGVSRLIGEYNVYALQSYIGYRISYPEDAATMTGLSLSCDTYSPDNDNVTIWVYDSEEHFNAMDSHYILSCTGSSLASIPKPASGYLYLLMEIASVNNTTPCVSSISVRFA